MPLPKPTTNIRRGIPRPVTFRAPDSDTQIRARPHAYNAAVANRVCERIMNGESLGKIAEDPRMPSKRTIIRWLANPELVEFREQYYYAKRVYAEMLVEEIIEIADSNTHDWEKVYNKDGHLIDLKPNNEAIQRSRVRIDTRKWLAAKMMPRMYGDNTQVQLDATGDLARLLAKAVNKDNDLPPAIEGELVDDG